MRGRRPPAHPEDPEAAYALAVRVLARQPQSRAALEDRLRRRGYTDEAASAAVERAAEQGYLDDREYARSLVRRRSRARGQALIAQELRAKGVADEAVSEALTGIDEKAQEATALTLARQLAGQPSATYYELLARVGPKLSRRGFSAAIIRRVSRELFTEWAESARFDTPSEHN